MQPQYRYDPQAVFTVVPGFRARSAALLKQVYSGAAGCYMKPVIVLYMRSWNELHMRHDRPLA